MQWNRKYDYPKSSRATVDGIRRYLLGEEKLPSVTSILDAVSYTHLTLPTTGIV